MRRFFVIATMSATMACGGSPPAPAPTPAVPPAEAPPPVASAATQKADALIEDLRRREAAQAKQDRENPPPPAPRLDQLVRQPAPVIAAPVTATPATVPVAQTAAANARDEQWWKNEMRTAEVRLADNSRRLQEARDQRAMASRQMEAAVKASPVVFAQAQEAFNRANADVGRLEAEVRNDAAAVNRVREDARRANVPPGWLRWP